MARWWPVGLAAGVLLVTGCAVDEQIYVSNITDNHGRVCTFVYTSTEGVGWGAGRDIDVSQLDCEYPPPGRSPGKPTTIPMSPPP
ncbi:hypothetical protein [Spongiactinospora sp. TRM90649]|uniref:hypothetical protein n=1 Tax=Spongiactinospora sp. TRM90649 TaxID=3031114 RepID=UPI0023F6D3A1|nr:hypothetical protein [Spongiactinospora sp. TRM90649]MDF5758899.1 hypothetical protein [Spongiactinospora sp. TRM90649]